MGKILISACSLFLLSGLSSSAAAQGVPITEKKANAVIIDRNKKKVATPATESAAASVVAAGNLPADNVAPLPPNTILVRIRYQQELGYNDTQDTYGDKGPFSCTAFEVTTTTLVTGSTPFGADKPVGNMDPKEPMRAGDGLYSCWYMITDLPFRAAIKVFGTVRDRPHYLSEAWLSGRQAAPPSGQVRTVIGSRSITLTAQQPSAVVDMEMVYRAPTAPPR